MMKYACFRLSQARNQLSMAELYGQMVIQSGHLGAAFEEADEANGNGKINDQHRVSYLVGHLKAVQRAIQDGANTKGYMHWSLFDNFDRTADAVDFWVFSAFRAGRR